MKFSLWFKLLLVILSFTFEEASATSFPLSLIALSYLFSDKTFFRLNSYFFWGLLFILSALFSSFSRIPMIFYFIIYFGGAFLSYLLWKNLDEKREVSKLIVNSLVFLVLYVSIVFLYKILFQISIFSFQNLIIGWVLIFVLFCIYAIFKKKFFK